MTARTATTPSTRLTAVLLAVSACSGDGVPDDQVLQPADGTPDGFAAADLGAVGVAVPEGWDRQPAATPAPNIESTVWRGPLSGGRASEGADVRVITDPQQPADDACTSLAASAMATLGARGVEPDAVVWPDADLACSLSYDTRMVSPGTPTSATVPALVTRTLVLDLADGTQVQVTVLSGDDGGEVAEDVLSTVRVTDGAED